MNSLDASGARKLARRRLDLSRQLKRSVLGLCVAASLCLTSPALGQSTRTAPRTAPQPAKPAQALAANAPTASQLKVMAVVNGEQISRQELAQECLRRYGEEVLESVVNRYVITQACQEAGITITDQDVTNEISRIAKKFGLSVDNWIVMLERERGIGEEQYRNEIIWPTLALRSLASDRMQITQEELQRAFESEFGPKVKARIISVSSKKKAEEIHALVTAKPEQFGEIAKNHSEDVNSASAHGLIPPISKHIGHPEIEQVAFSLGEGEVSPIIHVANQYIILKCEKHLPETLVPSQHLADATNRLKDRLHDEKLREASTELFEELQKKANVINVYGDEKLRAQYPGVAASINGKAITIAQLAEECITRHGTEVLDGEINRKVLTQELRRKKLQVTQEDLDAEVYRAALTYGFLKKDGSGEPDLEAWQKAIEENDGATVELYISDAVWPSVALKKLVGDSVKITEDDLQKGFQANYGERVEVLAIVLADNRQAQKVWEQARSRPTDDFFGQLAEQYSIDPVSRGNAGRVPPIRMHSGQPILEEEAFKLKPGEISGIIAIEDKFIILRCLGRTRPVVSKFEDVRDALYEDLHDKKLRLAMAREFERLRESAQIDNFLAGTSQQGAAAAKVLGPAKADTQVKPASGQRPVATPRVGSRPTTQK